MDNVGGVACQPLMIVTAGLHRRLAGFVLSCRLRRHVREREVHPIENRAWVDLPPLHYLLRWLLEIDADGILCLLLEEGDLDDHRPTALL